MLLNSYLLLNLSERKFLFSELSTRWQALEEIFPVKGPPTSCLSIFVWVVRAADFHLKTSCSNCPICVWVQWKCFETDEGVEKSKGNVRAGKKSGRQITSHFVSEFSKLFPILTWCIPVISCSMLKIDYFGGLVQVHPRVDGISHSRFELRHFSGINFRHVSSA